MCVNQTQRRSAARTLTPINPVVQRGGGGEAVSDVPVWGGSGWRSVALKRGGDHPRGHRRVDWSI